MDTRNGRVRNRWWAVVLVASALAGCAGGEPLAVPDAEDIRAYYSYGGRLEADMSGNVAQLTVTQPADQLRRGGRLWAKVGPYVVLFTEETFQLFEDYPGLAGVRVVTRSETGAEVARALLRRGELSNVLWRRSLNIAGKARRDGTEKVALIEDLIEWGEDHTEFDYNPRYTRR